MVWFAILLFIAVGVLLIVRRGEVARGEAAVFGGRMPLGCVIAQGVLFLLLALATWLLYSRGVLGD